MSLEDLDRFEEKRSFVENIRSRRKALGFVLPAFLLDRFYPPEVIEQFEERRAETRESLVEILEEFDDIETQIRKRMSSAEQAANPFEVDLTSIRIRLDQAHDCISNLEELDESYLTEKELAEREDTVESIADLEEWLEAYERVGQDATAAQSHLESAIDELPDIQLESWDLSSPEDLPEATLPHYLEREAVRSCAWELGLAHQHIQQCYDRIKSSDLGVRYLERVDGAKSLRRRLDTVLANYNEWFYEQEQSAHSNLFTDIDEAGHDLSDEQCRAVVRDDKYNLVIAGAGAGKTVTLTHRAAYLAQRDERVLPSDILAITYTNNAADVMSSRLRNKFGLIDVETSTFHSLGLKVINEESGREPEIVDERERENLIRRFVRQEMDRSSSAFQREYVRFLRHYYDDVEDRDIEEKAEEVSNQGQLVTLRGEEAYSRSEKRIADFLFVRNVEYEYRGIQNWFENIEGGGQYQPAFYLPEFDVVISHRPVDTAGDPRDWAEFDTRSQYERYVEWERQRLAERDDGDLVETYEFEYEADRIKEALEDRLPRVGVVFDDSSLEELIKQAYDETVTRNQIRGLFNSFITNAKQLDLSPDEVDERVRDAKSPKQEAFGECVRRLFRRYEVELRNMGAIDFPDMLNRAVEYMQENPEKYTTEYEQILVDEFQDISPAEVRFLKCFVKSDNDTHLFCVGDDWQSIYSFAGSDVDYFIDFGEYFETPTRTDLTANYRCPETVVEAGDRLISNNERQLEKQTRALAGTDTDILVYDLGESPRAPDYEVELAELTAARIERYLSDGAEPNEIMVLSRTKVYYDEIEDACKRRGIEATTNPERKDEPDEYVRLYSVHQAKGAEARHVIIAHAVEHVFGFPSQVEDSTLLDPVRIAPEDSEAEERRLFYVALTRTTDTLEIISSVGNRSRFLDEIDDCLTTAPTVTALGNDERRTDVGEAAVDKLFDKSDAFKQYGVLADSTGEQTFAIFADDDVEPLDTHGRYRIEGARIDEYRGEYKFILDEQTDVTRLGDREGSL